MIAPSWPKVVRPVADGKDVASCGLSIGLLLASFFQDRRHNGAPFAANTSKETTPLSCDLHVQHNLIYREGGGTLNSSCIESCINRKFNTGYWLAWWLAERGLLHKV